MPNLTRIPSLLAVLSLSAFLLWVPSQPGSVDQQAASRELHRARVVRLRRRALGQGPRRSGQRKRVQLRAGDCPSESRQSPLGSARFHGKAGRAVHPPSSSIPALATSTTSPLADQGPSRSPPSVGNWSVARPSLVAPYRMSSDWSRKGGPCRAPGCERILAQARLWTRASSSGRGEIGLERAVRNR